MLDSAGDHAKRYTIALCAEKGQGREVFATGTLLKVWDEYFIVTAGHVVTRMRGAPEGVHLLGWNPSANHLVHLEGVEFHSVDSESCDVGLVRLPYGLALSMADPPNYLDLEQIDSYDVPKVGASYLVCGFPTALYLSEPRKLGLIRYLTRSRGDECKRAYDPAVDIILSYRPEKQKWRGVELSEISLKGMSGGGIWRFFAPGSRQAWTPSDLRLVGVQHSWRGDLLRGTRIASLLRVLAEMKPDLSKLIHQRHPSAKTARLGG